MKILITGAAGFIGFHLSKKLLEAGFHVIGVDNLNPYYDVKLKEARLENLYLITKKKNSKFNFLLKSFPIIDFPEPIRPIIQIFFFLILVRSNIL